MGEHELATVLEALARLDARLDGELQLLRQEVLATRRDLQQLRAGLAAVEARRNADIADTKKKSRGWHNLRNVFTLGSTD